MARPVCRSCGKYTTPNKYEERGSRCATCYNLSLLKPYNATIATKTIHRLRRNTLRWDQVIAKIRREMRPPPGSDEWKLHHVIELDSQRLKWGREIAREGDRPVQREMAGTSGP